MRDGRGKFDVPHALAAHFGAGNFYAALLADDTLITDAFIFTAMAFPVLGRPEDLFAEQTVFFRFLRAVIDGFRLRYFTVRPFPDFLGRCHSDLNGVKIV